MKSSFAYQNFLRSEFERRRAVNNAYSLRAYARDLRLPSTKLSQYLSGQCGLSASKALEISGKLRLSPREADIFVTSAEAAHARDRITREAAREKLRVLQNGDFASIEQGQTAILADWRRVALLLLLDVETLGQSVEKMRAAIGLSEDEVQAAVKELEAAGFIKRAGGKWETGDLHLETQAEEISAASRTHQKQLIFWIAQEFEKIALNRREVTTSLINLDSSLLPDLKRLMRRHRREIAALIERSEKIDSVFVCATQLVPVYGGDGVKDE